AVAALDNLPHVFQDHVTARPLRQAVADLLADQNLLILRDPGQLRRRAYPDGLDRHRVVEAKPLPRDAVIAAPLATLIADRLQRRRRGRRGNTAQTRQKIGLYGRIDVQTLFRALAKELALEPVELRLQ